MEPVYITGHKNPDTDSIVAAIAYAALRNALGERDYMAARLGMLSEETAHILERFGFEAPVLIHDLRTQVKDMDYDHPPILSGAVTVHRAWDILSEERASSALPITDEEGKLFGMLSIGDIAQYDMQFVEETLLHDVPLFNLISCLDGQIWGDTGDVDSLTGEMVIAVPQQKESWTPLSEGAILLTGNDPQILSRAFEEKAAAVIVCNSQLDTETWQDKGDTAVITTPYDPYRAARLLIQSVPVSRIARTTELVSFREDDYLDNVRETTLKSRYRSYPVLDKEGKVIGTLGRYHLLRPKRKKVILVDHSEVSQSVDGLEEAEILEIIDHHRLADVETPNPIYVRNEPVGATTTIIASMYQERGIMPGKKLAGLMAAAILSDTVVFQSPTCTERDKVMAERMARIAGVSLQELGQDIFSVSMSPEQSAEELLHHDYKVYEIADHSLAVAQITGINSGALLARKQELLLTMEAERQAKGMDLELLMLTDVLRRGTELLAVGDTEEIGQALGARFIDNQAFLPGVMSRKKQIIPALSVMWG